MFFDVAPEPQRRIVDDLDQAQQTEAAEQPEQSSTVGCTE